MDIPPANVLRPISTNPVATRHAKIRKSLHRLSLAVEAIRVVEHSTKASFLRAREEASEKTPSGRVSTALMKALYKATVLPGGFCNVTTGEVHIQRNTGTVITFHETVHGSDVVNPKLKGIIDETNKLELTATWREPINWIRFKLAEMRIVSILEGRAKFCERIAAEDKENFTFFERLRFRISSSAEVFVLFALGYSVIDSPTKFDLPVDIFASWLAIKLLPYVFGKQLMDVVHKKLNDAKETLALTARNPPSLSDFFHPYRYANSLLCDRDQV